MMYDWLIKRFSNPSVTERDYSLEYLTVTCTAAGDFMAALSSSLNASYTRDFDYSINGGAWITASPVRGQTVTVVTLAVGDVMRLRRDGNNARYLSFPCGGDGLRFTLSGNMMSFQYGDNFVGKTTIRDNRANCFDTLFKDCTAVTDATDLVLPALTLSQGCYSTMFYGCENLISGPTLPAAVLTNNCYYRMFYNCKKLSRVKCLATTNIATSSSTSEWLINTAATGTFVKAAGATWPSGGNGIPSGWTVVDDTE